MLKCVKQYVKKNMAGKKEWGEKTEFIFKLNYEK